MSFVSCANGARIFLTSSSGVFSFLPIWITSQPHNNRVKNQQCREPTFLHPLFRLLNSLVYLLLHLLHLPSNILQPIPFIPPPLPYILLHVLPNLLPHLVPQRLLPPPPRLLNLHLPPPHSIHDLLLPPPHRLRHLLLPPHHKHLQLFLPLRNRLLDPRVQHLMHPRLHCFLDARLD